MKKLVVILLLVMGMAIAGEKPADMRSDIKLQVRQGYEFIGGELINYQQATADAIVVYADNIAGYSSINFYGFGTISTLSAQAVFANGDPIPGVSAQIITEGTDLTDFKSPFYKLTIPATGATAIVSGNFLIAD